MDKVQKIREEVARLELCTMDEHMKFYSECAEAEYNALCKVEDIIDSMQEEPVSEDLEEMLKDYAYQVAYDLSNDWLKENATWDDIETAVKLGALWQKQQLIDKACEWLNYQLNLPSDFEVHFRKAMEE